MKNKIKTILFIAIISLGLSTGVNAVVNGSKADVKTQTAVQKPVDVFYQPVKALDIVANPAKYLNKRVKIKALFDKFSTLGLDYKPAYRSSDKYITFLIKREDVVNKVVPLSEMKNFIKRDVAEKYIDLKPGDEIEYSGLVFSNALGDVWIDVEKFVVLNQKSKEKESIKK